MEALARCSGDQTPTGEEGLVLAPAALIVCGPYQIRTLLLSHSWEMAGHHGNTVTVLSYRSVSPEIPPHQSSQKLGPNVNFNPLNTFEIKGDGKFQTTNTEEM